jgi:hypothetical protein
MSKHSHETICASCNDLVRARIRRAQANALAELRHVASRCVPTSGGADLFAWIVKDIDAATRAPRKKGKA